MATKAAKRRKSKTRVGLSVMEEERLKGRLRKTFPSEPWIDASVRRFEDVKADGEVIAYRFHDPKAFPPPADTTPMVVCPECGRTTPAISMEGGRCMDHQPKRLHNAYGSSPSGNAIQMLQHLRGRIKETKLKPMDKSALRREIRQFNAGKVVVNGKKNVPPSPPS